MADANKSVFIKLNGGNYFNWKFRMEMYLIKEKLWKIVNEDSPPIPADDATAPQRAPYQTWVEKDEEARAAIGLKFDDDQYCHLRGKNTAKECWLALKHHHEKDSLGNKVSLMRRICAKRMGENETMERHIAEFNELFQKLADLGADQLAEKWRVAIILSSLPKDYDSMVSALEIRKEDELTMSLVQSKLLDEYARRNVDNHSDGDAVLKAAENRSCFFCKRTNHVKKDCRKYQEWKLRKEKENSRKEKARGKLLLH